MGDPLPSYADLAAQFGADWCRGACPESHETGAVVDGRIHWRERHPTRPGIRRFLYLIAEAEVRFAAKPTRRQAWRIHYRALRRAIEYSQDAGLRLPSAVWERDRLRLKSMLLKVPNTNRERQEAMRWVLH